ncbi:hypothetical protein LTR56_011530 [Elasticomyces elasticus]|nr:hypothetical protein LTR56_011530 [Elasticomyces elasticus]KAK3643259.1 hypothetical protein LTR22_015726 [Elasticomyces elasticus]KAK4930249.1 hypothetical protein LTR49_003283 [Elasticomyces elasticus]KAK5761412.1 hypothetical protein LTS12_008516 [Elasticomyces elasticus]
MPPKRTRVQRSRTQAPKRRPQQTSRFFSIPVELRDHIYEYLLPQTMDVILVQPTGKGLSQNHHVSPYQPLPLSQVCEQIRNEVSARAKAQSFGEVVSVCFHAYDFNFSALQGYLTMLANKDPARLSSFKRNGALVTTHTLIVQLSVSDAWCKNPETQSLTNWSKFVRDTASVSATETLAEYQFSEVEDKDVVRDALSLLAAGPEPDKEALQIAQAFSRWYMFRGDKARERWFAKEVRRQEQEAMGLVDRRVLHNRATHDEHEALWAPEFNEEESDDSDSEEESEAEDDSEGSEGGSEEDDEDESDEE